MSTEPLSPAAMERFEAHLALPGFGVAGQQAVARGRVAIVGLGGLGCPAAQYLAAAGVGSLTLIDDDVVTLSNLPRQILFGHDDIGSRKVAAAARNLARQHPDALLRTEHARLTAANARELLADHEVVLDASDNFATRYVVSDACVLEQTASVSGSVYRYEGQLLAFAPPAPGCYRCVFPNPGPAETPCHEAGVFGPLVGMIGAAMAAEALRLLAGGSSSLAGRLLVFDAESMSSQELAIEAAADCPACGAGAITAPTAAELGSSG